jgi:hypothetical protein
MSNQFLKLRRSAVPGKIPETSSLDLGELAINTYDGQLFLKKSGSQGEIVTVVGSTGSFTGSFFGNGAGLTSIPASGITGLNLSRIATGSITASVSNTDISASFRITSGSNTLLNVTKDGFVWIGNGSFTNQGYQLDVAGSSRLGIFTLSSGTSNADLILSNTSANSYLLSSKIHFRPAGGSYVGQVSSTGWTFGSNNDNIGNRVWFNYGNYFNNNDDLIYIQGGQSNNNGNIVSYINNLLHLNPTINNAGGNSINTFRGIYYNPTLTSLLNTTHIFLQSTSGDVLLGTTSGSVGIGANTSINASAILDITSTTKGFLPTRTATTASITNPVQGLLTYITASGDVEGLWQYRTGSNGWVQFLHNSSSIPASSVVGLNLSRISTGSITASVSSDISASFRITSGSNTLLNVTREGFVWIGNGSFTNQAYQLDVQGTGRFTGDILVNSITIGRGSSNVASNVVVGETSGTSFTTGNGNVALGYRVLTSVTTQVNNIGIGYDSLRFATTTRTIGIGFESGYSMKGLDNVGVGEQTLKTSIGDGNVAVGSLALRANTSGAFSVAIGYAALLANTTSGSNTAIGTQALSSNNGNGNVVVGYQVMYSATGAQRNVVIGRESGWDISSSDNNVLVGYNTGRGITTGRANTIVGSVQGLASTLSNNIILADGDGNIRYRWDTVTNILSGNTYISGSFSINGSQFNNTSSVTSAGITTISQLSTSSYTSCFYNYTVASASNARSGQVMTVWNGNTIRYTEVVTTDIGDTSLVNVSASLASGFVRLQVSASSGWTFKNISNLL